MSDDVVRVVHGGGYIVTCDVDLDALREMTVDADRPDAPMLAVCKALLAEIDALNARVGTLMMESLTRDRRDEPHDNTEGDQ